MKLLKILKTILVEAKGLNQKRVEYYRSIIPGNISLMLNRFRKTMQEHSDKKEEYFLAIIAALIYKFPFKKRDVLIDILRDVSQKVEKEPKKDYDDEEIEEAKATKDFYGADIKEVPDSVIDLFPNNPKLSKPSIDNIDYVLRYINGDNKKLTNILEYFCVILPSLDTSALLNKLADAMSKKQPKSATDVDTEKSKEIDAKTAEMIKSKL